MIDYTVSTATDNDCAYSQKDNSSLIPIIGGVAVAVVLIISVIVIVLRKYYTTGRKK